MFGELVLWLRCFVVIGSLVNELNAVSLAEVEEGSSIELVISGDGFWVSVSVNLGMFKGSGDFFETSAVERGGLRPVCALVDDV